MQYNYNQLYKATNNKWINKEEICLEEPEHFFQNISITNTGAFYICSPPDLEGQYNLIKNIFLELASGTFTFNRIGCLYNHKSARPHYYCFAQSTEYSFSPIKEIGEPIYYGKYNGSNEQIVVYIDSKAVNGTLNITIEYYPLW